MKWCIKILKLIVFDYLMEIHMVLVQARYTLSENGEFQFIGFNIKGTNTASPILKTLFLAI